jgi:hypothetical protein
MESTGATSSWCPLSFNHRARSVSSLSCEHNNKNDRDSQMAHTQRTSVLSISTTSLRFHQAFQLVQKVFFFRAGSSSPCFRLRQLSHCTQGIVNTTGHEISLRFETMNSSIKR